MAETKLKVLVFFVGTRGDVMPGVAICKALEDRGHQAAMAVCPGVEDSVRAYGVRCFVVGRVPFTWRNDKKVMSPEEVGILRRSMNAKEFLSVANKHGVSWNLEECLPEALAGCRDLVDQEDYDVILCNICTQVASHRLMKNRPNLKVIRTTFTFWNIATSAWAPGGYEMSGGFMNKLKHLHFLFCVFMPFIFGSNIFKKEFEELKKITGIDHDVGLGFFKKLAETPCLGLWSPNLQDRPADFPQNMQVTGSLFLPQLPNWQPSGSMEAFLQQKPLLLSFGSMLGVETLEEAFIQAAKRLGISVLWISDKKRKEQLITSTFDFNGGEPGQEIEKGVFQVDYAPFDYLLPKVSLVVCHGGAGTVFRAIGSGVPVVICPVITPIIADQMLHAQWAERKGFGAFLRPLEPTIQECEEALQKALACKGTCDAAAAKVKQEDGAKAAAAAIEQLAEKDDTKPQSGCCAGICKLFRRRPSGQP